MANGQAEGDGASSGVLSIQVTLVCVRLTKAYRNTHISSASLELFLYLRMTQNPRSFSLYLMSAGITGVSGYAWPGLHISILTKIKDDGTLAATSV